MLRGLTPPGVVPGMTSWGADVADFGTAVSFGVHRLWFAVRDLLTPPEGVLQAIGVGEGQRVLDYGCGAGSFSVAAARLVGLHGQVYAADGNAATVQYVRGRVRREGLGNVQVIHTDRATGLESGTIDTVLLYDVLHDLQDAAGVLRELRRVLKPGGILSVRDHHLSAKTAAEQVCAAGSFQPTGADRKTLLLRAVGGEPR